MNIINKQRGQLLIIYLTTLFVGGSSVALGVLATGKPIKEIEKSVKTYVLDSSRQKQTLALLEQWKVEGKKQKKKYKEQRETLLALMKKHDANKATFQSTIDGILKMDQQTTKRLLDIQYNLRDDLTQDEWMKIFSNKN